MQDSDSALARHRNGHALFGDRVHRGGEQGCPETDVLGELRRGVSFTRNHIGMRGEQHDIVIGQPYETEGILICHCSDPDLSPDLRPESSQFGFRTS